MKWVGLRPVEKHLNRVLVDGPYDTSDDQQGIVWDPAAFM